MVHDLSPFALVAHFLPHPSSVRHWRDWDQDHQAQAHYRGGRGSEGVGE